MPMRQPNGFPLKINICAMISERQLTRRKYVRGVERVMYDE